MKPHSGFTLVEILVALLVATVLLAVALPAWSAAMATGRAGSARAALAATVVDSVRRAGNTGVDVVACPASATGGCADTSDWSGGWLAFVDVDGNRARGADEPLVDQKSALEGGIRLRSTAGRRRIVFQPSGGNAGSNLTFTLCHDGGAIRATSMVLSNAGRFRSVPATATAAAACEG